VPLAKVSKDVPPTLFPELSSPSGVLIQRLSTAVWLCSYCSNVSAD